MKTKAEQTAWLKEKGLDQILDNVIDHLEGHLGAVLKVDQVEPFRNNDGCRVTFRAFDKEHFGICKHMIKTMALHFEWWIGDDGKWSIQPGFRYSHHDGGSNGHDLNFYLSGNVAWDQVEHYLRGE